MRVPSGLTGTEIASDLVDRHRSLGAFGKPAWQSHLPLRALIRQRLGERYANFFAVPNLDVESGVLRWTSDASGPVRSWQSLDPQERALRAFDVEEIRGRLLGLEQELSRQGGTDVSGAASFAALLKQARCVPAHEGFIYMVGEQPVVAFWGFETRAPEAPPVPPAAVLPAQAPAMPRQDALPQAPLPSAPVHVSHPQTDETPSRPWWRWLLWLLGLLLLLFLILLLLGLLRGCNLPGLPVIAGSAGVVGSSTSGEGSAAVREPAAQGSQGVQGAPGGPGDQGAGPGVAPSSEGGTGAGLTPADQRPAPGAPAPALGAAEAPNALNPPNVPNAPNPPNAPNAPKSPEARPPLVVPPQASSLGFLKGDWEAQTGLMDRQTRQPLDLSMRFDDQGQGRLRLQRADGSSCEGPLQASMAPAGLVMEAKQALPCSNGGSFESPRIECTPLRDGRTDCFGRNPDGSRFGMEVRRR